MLGFRASFALIIFVTLTVISGCGNRNISDANQLRPNINSDFDTGSANADSNTVTDDEITLNSLVTFPFEPTENVWRKDGLNSNGDVNIGISKEAGDKKLTAVLQFSDEDTKALLDNLNAEAKPKAVSFEPESWFPAELIAKSDTTGNSKITGNSYPATDFYKPPFIAGTITYIADTNFFILVLNSN
ncbi:MAG: hypothetical protein ACK5NT_04050 [Pyrinomonadaceae bacterium]